MGESSATSDRDREQLAFLAQRRGLTLTDHDLAAVAPIHEWYLNALTRLREALAPDEEPAVVFCWPVGRKQS